MSSYILNLDVRSNFILITKDSNKLQNNYNVKDIDFYMDVCLVSNHPTDNV